MRMGIEGWRGTERIENRGNVLLGRDGDTVVVNQFDKEETKMYSPSSLNYFALSFVVPFLLGRHRREGSYDKSKNVREEDENRVHACKRLTGGTWAESSKVFL